MGPVSGNGSLGKWARRNRVSSRTTRGKKNEDPRRLAGRGSLPPDPIWKPGGRPTPHRHDASIDATEDGENTAPRSAATSRSQRAAGHVAACGNGAVRMRQFRHLPARSRRVGSRDPQRKRPDRAAFARYNRDVRFTPTNRRRQSHGLCRLSAKERKRFALA